VLTNLEIRCVLEGLPTPYSDIAIYGRAPKIDRDPINEEFATWLKERRIISSFAPLSSTMAFVSALFGKHPLRSKMGTSTVRALCGTRLSSLHAYLADGIQA
jgi:hypothetical protein